MIFQIAGTKKYKCKSCNELGHIAKVCQKGQTSTNYLKDYSQKSNTSEEEVTEMSNLRSNQLIIEPLKVSIKINNKPIVMEMDSGAGMSVLPHKLYQEAFKDITLQSSIIKLKMYDSSIVTPVGEIQVIATLGKHSVPARLLIVKSNCRPLLGRELMLAFKMFKNFQVKLLAINFNYDKNIKNRLSLQLLLTEYANVFNNKSTYNRYI